ncbi:hypothetical protein MMC16_000944 [Acarospora aff. strigata]|nr:hypothetical protein [Acarospora aff. strigata]
MPFPISTAEVKDLPSDTPQSTKTNSSNFLTLLPVQSASHQQRPPALKANSAELGLLDASQDALLEPIAAFALSSIDTTGAVLKARRSSSVSTTNSEAVQKRRFLRLGPVHSGEDSCNNACVEEEET